jgi:multimeric flavodoxin WrbA
MASQLAAEKVLVLLGSPRKNGSTATLAQQLIKGAEDAGAQVESIYLNAQKVSPCQGCYVCQKPESKGCAVDDDMQTIYPKLIEADAWVFATPVYFFSFSAQTKLLLDRCFALNAYGVKPWRDKRIAVAMTYGGKDPFSSGCINALRTFHDIANYVHAQIVGMVYDRGPNPEDVSSNANLLARAEELGKKLVVGSRRPATV